MIFGRHFSRKRIKNFLSDGEIHNSKEEFGLETIEFLIETIVKENITLESISEIASIAFTLYSQEESEKIKSSLIEDTFEGGLDTGYFDINEDYIEYYQIGLIDGTNLGLAIGSTVLDSPNPDGVLWVVKLKSRIPVGNLPATSLIWKKYSS